MIRGGIFVPVFGEGDDSGSAQSLLDANRADRANATVPALVLRPMRPREVIFVLRAGCGEDARALCADVPPGGGRIVQCLATQAASLSPACTNALGQFAAQ